jgi:hypothetical protein
MTEAAAIESSCCGLACTSLGGMVATTSAVARRISRRAVHLTGDEECASGVVGIERPL